MTMHFGRRAVLRALIGVVFSATGVLRFGRRPAAAAVAATLSAARAAGTDAAEIRAIMTSCVASEASFYGKCGEWPLAWAEQFVATRPDSPVLTKNGVAVAFHEVPPMRALEAPPGAEASDEARARHALREQRRKTFRVSAAGVRDDLLTAEESVVVFREIIHLAYTRALALGYEYAECFAPWEKHPRLERKFTDYPGLELVEKVARAQGDGPDVWWLRWRLEDAIRALEAEGAGRWKSQGEV